MRDCQPECALYLALVQHRVAWPYNFAWELAAEAGENSAPLCCAGKFCNGHCKVVPAAYPLIAEMIESRFGVALLFGAAAPHLLRIVLYNCQNCLCKVSGICRSANLVEDYLYLTLCGGEVEDALYKVFACGAIQPTCSHYYIFASRFQNPLL